MSEKEEKVTNMYLIKEDEKTLRRFLMEYEDDIICEPSGLSYKELHNNRWLMRRNRY